MSITDAQRKLFDEIDKKRVELGGGGKYPIEAGYGSRCSLWSCELKDGIVSQELYNAASKYYGELWTYVGD